MALRVAPEPAVAVARAKLYSFPDDCVCVCVCLKMGNTNLVSKKPTLHPGARKGFVGAIVSSGYCGELRLPPAQPGLGHPC